MPQPSPTSGTRRRPGSAAGAVLRALVSLGLLLVLLVGIPALLWWATAVVGPDGVRAMGHLLSTQDSGQVFLLALAVVGWIGWGMFAASVLMEIPAQLAGRTAPQLKGLLGQRTAATLVGAIFLVLPAGTALASTSTPAQAATPVASAPVQAGTTTPGSTARPPAMGQEHRAGHRDGIVTYTVQQVRPAESLWSIAKQQLGDGNRWQEIADLNTGRTMVDGTHFRADGPIQPGWILHLPSHAPHHAAASDGTGPSRTHTVRAGESLSGIAQSELGAPDEWPEIYHLNQGQPQPEGHRLTDPDLIYPREILLLPEQNSTAHSAPPATEQHHHAQPSAPPAATGPALVAPAPATPPATTPQDQPSTTPSVGASTPGTTADPHTSDSPTAAPSAPDAAAPSSTAAHATATGSRMPLYALGGGLLAAAVLTMLAARRVFQQRRRQPGRRIAMPAGSAAATERALRATEHPDAAVMVDAALRTAAVHLAAAGQELPAIAAAVLTPSGLDLHLQAPAAAVPPFAAVNGDLARWHCPTGSSELLGPDATDTVDAPYPALITLGGDGNGWTVLVDLEQYPLLHITGPDRLQVLRAIAIELATSRYADHLDVTVFGDQACPRLPELLPERFTAAPSVRAAARAATAHHSDQTRALAAVGKPTVRQARLIGEDQGAAWTPHIVLADLSDAGDDGQEPLVDLAALAPRTATVVITTADGPGDLPDDAFWLDTAAGQVSVPGAAVTADLQLLPDADYADLVDLVALSDDTTPDAPPQPANVPAPVATDAEVLEERIASAAAELPAPVLSPGPTDAPLTAAPFPPPSDTASQGSGRPSGPGGLMAKFASFDLDDTEQATATDESLERDLPSPTDGPDLEDAPDAGPAAPLHEDVAVVATSPEAPVLEAPVIRVLGPVDVIGARGTVDSKNRRTVTEIAAWMILHPGQDHHALDEAIWPGRNVSRKTRNPWITRLRSWLGADNAGDKFLPLVASTEDALYRMANTVTSDWDQFQDMTATGLATPGETGDRLLRLALELVRGRPFAGAPARRYVWAENLAQDMISAITDTAAQLAQRRLDVGDPRGALWAATRGLDASPESERLYRLVFQARHALGDHDGLERAAQQLGLLCDELGSDMEDATVDVLRSLLPASAPRS